MFEIGWSELLIVAIVAIIVVGPRELPKMLRAFGNTVGRLRRMAGEFQDQFREAMREAEVEEARREMEKLRDLNPLNDIRDEIKSVADQARIDPNQIAAPELPSSSSTAPALASSPPAVEAPEAAPAIPSALAPAAPEPAVETPVAETPKNTANSSAPPSSAEAPREPERSSAAGSA